MTTRGLFAAAKIIADASRCDGISSRLLEERIIYINSVIGKNKAHETVAQLLFLDSKSPSKPIHMYFNSHFSSTYAGLEIYEAMRYAKAPIKTTCFGEAGDVSSLLLAAGAKGERRSLANATITIPDLADDLKIAELYSRHTGQSVEVIQESTAEEEDEGKLMSPEEAKEFGVIDEVIYSSKPL